MTLSFKKRASHRNGALMILAVGLLGGVAATLGLSAPVQATAAMSPLDKLVAENEINQQFALYGLLLDGDGLAKKDLRALADKTFTQDDVYENFSWDGKPGNHVAGRDAFYDWTSKLSLPADDPIAHRHFVLTSYFDELTPTTAKTRTTSFVLKVTRNMLGADCKKAGEDACGGRLTSAQTFTYHNSWTKTAAGWQMSHIVLRGDE